MQVLRKSVGSRADSVLLL